MFIIFSSALQQSHKNISGETLLGKDHHDGNMLQKVLFIRVLVP